MTPQSAIVDVAAGTGLFAESFLTNGNTVTAIEPNAEMRAACAELQRESPQLQVLEGTAENTGLPDACADFVTVAQALHWFDRERTRMEFAGFKSGMGGASSHTMNGWRTETVSIAALRSAAAVRNRL